jgi:hypothetical protein
MYLSSFGNKLAKLYTKPVAVAVVMGDVLVIEIALSLVNVIVPEAIV